jgi:hypothetical protein
MGEIESSAGGGRGIAVLANDKVLHWLLPFLESYLETNSATPLYVIPFDDNVALTHRAASVYGAVWVDDDMSAIDALAKCLYPLFPHHRRRLRKLKALALPLDEVIYLDADTILFRDFGRAFGVLRPGQVDFVIASTSEDYVYNNRRSGHPFLHGVTLFNDGFFLTSRSVLSFADFERIVDSDEKLFHSVRKRGMLFAQPLVNFVVHRLALKVASLADCVPDASNESYYKAEGITIGSGGPVDWQGREIYFAHWAGATGRPRRRVFDSIWQDYARRAQSRMNAWQS